MPEAEWKHIERKVANWLSEWWYRRKGVLRRSPMSGGWAHSKKMGDIIVDESKLREDDPEFPFYVEVKRRKLFSNIFDLWHPQKRTGIWALFLKTIRLAGQDKVAILAVWVKAGQRGRLLLMVDAAAVKELLGEKYENKFADWLPIEAQFVGGVGGKVLTRII